MEMRHKFSVPHTSFVVLDLSEVDHVFNGRLDELIDGWYIAKAAMYRKPAQLQFTDPERLVLCHECEPHPHNGDTWREREVELDDPDFQIQIAAIRLRDLIAEQQKRRDR